MSLSPYINFSGNTREVVDYYADKLGANVLGVVTFEQLGRTEQSPEANSLVAHAHLKIGESSLFLPDTPPSYMTLTPGDNMSLMFQSSDAAEVQHIWDALAPDGQVRMPIGATPWTSLYGQLTDKFGVIWLVNYIDPAYAPPQG